MKYGCCVATFLIIMYAKVIPRRQYVHILKIACNLYIEQIERAGGNLLGKCSCGQPVGSHLHEIPPAPAPGH